MAIYLLHVERRFVAQLEIQKPNFTIFACFVAKVPIFRLSFFLYLGHFKLEADKKELKLHYVAITLPGLARYANFVKYIVVLCTVKSCTLHHIVTFNTYTCKY